MTAGIYKQGQGYWVRLMSTIGLALMVMMGVVWIWDQVAAVQVGDIEAVYVQAVVAVLVVLVFGGIGYWLIGRKHSVVDFMVATEGEMKKVNWSTRREIYGSTVLVIALTLIIAAFCKTFDLTFSSFFQWMDVLKT